MATPDVRVRLSAEGVAEVVAALRKIQTEAQATSKNSGRSFGLLNGALGTMKGLLAGVGVALSVGALARFARGALDTADQMANLAERIGTTVERASALSAIALKSEADINALQASTGRFARQLVELREGAPGAVEAFGKLGLASRDFKGKDTAESMALVAKQMSAVEAGTGKTAIALQLFGKQGLTLIPMLNELGEKGLEKVVAEARQLGLVLDDDLAQKMDEMSDQLDTVTRQAKILAAQFLGGLAPDLQTALGMISGELGTSAQAWRSWGHEAGKALRYVLLVVGTVVDAVVALLDTLRVATNSAFDDLVSGAKRLWTSMGVLGAVVKETLSGNISAAKAAWKSGLAEIEASEEAQRKRQEERLTQWRARVSAAEERFRNRLAAATAPEFVGPPAPPPRREGEVGDGEDLAGARLEAQRAALEKEISLVRAHAKLREEQEKQSFERGLTNVRAYFAERRRILQGQAGAEEAFLQKEKRLVEKSDLEQKKKVAEVLKIEEQILKLRSDEKQALLELTDDERQAVQRLAQDRLGLEQRILEAQGRRHEAALLAIEEEIARADLLLRQSAVGPPEDRSRELERLRSTLLAGEAFQQATDEAEAAMQDLALERLAIEKEVERGRMSQLAGEKALLAVEQQRLPILTHLAEEMLRAAEATGDPERIRMAQEFQLSIQALGVSLDLAAQMMQRFGEEAQAAITGDLSNWLSQGVDEAENFGDAMRSLALSVVQSLRRIASEILATAAIAKISGLFSSLFGGGGSDFVGPPLPPGRAQGGVVRGPGTGTSDSILTRLSSGEFVVREKAVRQPGMLQHLEALNRMEVAPRGLVPADVNEMFHRSMTLAPISIDSVGPKRLADGGLVGAAPAQGGAAGGDSSLYIGLEEGMVLKALRTPAGQRVVVDVVAGNRRAIRNLIGGD